MWDAWHLKNVWLPLGTLVFCVVFALLWPAKWDPAVKLKERTEKWRDE